MKSGVIHVSSGAKRKLQKFRDAAVLGGTLEEILERADLTEHDLKTIEQASMCYKVTCIDALELNL
jgi:hypothetical protein